MTNLFLEKDIILKRVNGIETELEELRILSRQGLSEFSSGSGWKLAQFHLHRALEGVFNISTHILSRLPGGVASQYKEIAKQMGERGLIDKNFAATRLVEMAKYRNRLVHFYNEVKPEELHAILKNDLLDFDIFLSAVKKILDHPETYGLATD